MAKSANSKRIICFLSDFGSNSVYVAEVKGVILSIYKDVQIIDLTHQISPHNILEASFILKNTYKFFPKNTVFLTVVDPGVGTDRKIILVKTKNYYFLAPDNGLIYETIIKDGVEKIVEVKNKKYFLKEVSFTFHARDIFAPTLSHFLKDLKMEKLGGVLNIKEIVPLHLPKPFIKNNTLFAQIMHIDNFGNLVTNLDEKFFLSFVNNKKFSAFLNKKRITEYSTNYLSIKNKPFFIRGSFKTLEVALSKFSAKEYFKAKLGDLIKIKLQ